MPLPVAFSSDGSFDPDGTIVSYSWDFGDGAGTSTQANPSYTYTSAGSYLAVLTVTDDGGLSATASVDITVRKSKR
jgi:PKD repeat protein